MPENLNYGLFTLKNEAVENDAHRPGTHYLEYFQVALTVTTNLATAEVPTSLDEVIGVIGLGFMSTFAAGDVLNGLCTDGVITSSAVTVRGVTASIADGALSTRGYLVGTKRDTTNLLKSPVD